MFVGARSVQNVMLQCCNQQSGRQPSAGARKNFLGRGTSMGNLFRHLDKAIAFILIFTGMIVGVEHWRYIPDGIALSVILISLVLGIGSSLVSKAEV